MNERQGLRPPHRDTTLLLTLVAAGIAVAALMTRPRRLRNAEMSFMSGTFDWPAGHYHAS